MKETEKGFAEQAPREIGRQELEEYLREGLVSTRGSARVVILDRARRLRREADLLEVLVHSIPEVLPPKADEALLNLAMKAKG